MLDSQGQGNHPAKMTSETPRAIELSLALTAGYPAIRASRWDWNPNSPTLGNDRAIMPHASAIRLLFLSQLVQLQQFMDWRIRIMPSNGAT